MKKILFIMLSLHFITSVFSFEISFSSLADIFKTKISEVHFYNGSDENPQDFVGTIILKQIKSLDTPVEINLDGTSLKCYSQLQGYYLNTGRGNYILPLSSGDNIDNISVTGGLYSSCDGQNYNMVFGDVQYKYKDNKWFDLYAGFNYNLKSNKIKFASGFIPSFTLYNGVKPVGFIYDSRVGGVGFVGGNLKAHEVSEIQSDIINKIDSTHPIQVTYSGSNLVVNGLEIGEPDFTAVIKSFIGVIGGYNVSNSNFENKNVKKLVLKGMFANEKDINGGSKIAYSMGQNSLSKILNMARKNSFILCRGKWQSGVGKKYYNNSLNKINCFDAGDYDTGMIVIDYDISEGDYNPIIVTKGNIDVLIKRSMIGKHYLDVYIDKGKLLIYNDIDLVKIDKGGAYTENLGAVVTSGALIKGNFIVRGLLGGYNDSSGYGGFEHKLYINGMLASLNTISFPNESRLNYINSILDLGNNYTKDDINLEKIFTWQCEDNGSGTDGNNCSNQEDRWWQNALIIVKRYYKSMLIK